MSPTSLPAHRRVAAVLVLIPVMVALALWAFAWPAARTAPRDLPRGVAAVSYTQLRAPETGIHRGWRGGGG
ncbi:hypothetical protein ACFV05_02865, partial [Streptomyces pseudogriseolus]